MRNEVMEVPNGFQCNSCHTNNDLHSEKLIANSRGLNGLFGEQERFNQIRSRKHLLAEGVLESPMKLKSSQPQMDKFQRKLVLKKANTGFSRKSKFAFSFFVLGLALCILGNFHLIPLGGNSQGK